MASYQELRQQYPVFLFRKSQWQETDVSLLLEWEFVLDENTQFYPTMTIPLPDGWRERVTDEEISELALQIGMVELLSYWKLTASPTIVIEAGYFSPEQLDWWHELLLNGMGEYFYLNQIDFTQPDFVSFRCEMPKPARPTQTIQSLQSAQETSDQLDRMLVPIGGGKDSIVALELLRQWRQQSGPVKSGQIGLFAVNPTTAAMDVIVTSGMPSVVIQRTLDPQLFTLNQQGFLNGHTPFSALLSFISLLTAKLHGYTVTILGNEQSANEGNVSYLGRAINHQYSKSFHYESAFRQYVSTYLQPQFDTSLPTYFSLLRPFNELQIAKIFANQAEAYLPLFRSCNRGHKTNSWCGKCAKCLFAFTVLFPFLGEQQMTAIFGQNLFEKIDLLPIALDLIGQTKNKPFDCVGTYQESQVAFFLSYQWYLQTEQAIPPLLDAIFQQVPLNTVDQ
ncbi:hypothetical protein KC921_04915, partial [Candidatus Woesebacteria bacterium]|nr:hypothetical protein [Candidatus Woesebacteria bacterium]